MQFILHAKGKRLVNYAELSGIGQALGGSLIALDTSQEIEQSINASPVI